MEKQYEFRTLNAKDLFLMIRLVKKINLDSFKKLFNNEKVKSLTSAFMAENKDKESANVDELFATIGVEMMIDVANVIIDRLDVCEKEIFELLAAVTNKKKADIEKIDMDIFIEMIFELVQKEDFKKVFQKVVSLLQQGK